MWNMKNRRPVAMPFCELEICRLSERLSLGIKVLLLTLDECRSGEDAHV